MSDFKWDDASIERLKEMWAKGMSASQVAAVFGVSRNAVVGKLHRLDIKAAGRAHGHQGPIAARANAARASVVPPKPKAARFVPSRAEAKGEPLPMDEASALIPVQPTAIPAAEEVEGAVDFADLAPHHCRAPAAGIGRDGLMRYCGQSKLKGVTGEYASSYCPEHYHRFKTEWAPRRRREHGEVS
ncbi:MAG: GcrA family cell cycle regulator [Verrucomicrobiota bacterium]